MIRHTQILKVLTLTLALAGITGSALAQKSGDARKQTLKASPGADGFRQAARNGLKLLLLAALIMLIAVGALVADTVSKRRDANGQLEITLCEPDGKGGWKVIDKARDSLSLSVNVAQLVTGSSKQIESKYVWTARSEKGRQFSVRVARSGNVSLDLTTGSLNLNVPIEIGDVIIKDDEAKESPDGRSRHPGGINFKSVSTGAAKLVQAEVTLETRNNDSTKSRASKRIKDVASNTLLQETIDLRMAKGVFPRSYTVTIKGKCDPGNGEAWVDVSAVKTGSFTPSGPGVGPRKK